MVKPGLLPGFSDWPFWEFVLSDQNQGWKRDTPVGESKGHEWTKLVPTIDLKTWPFEVRSESDLNKSNGNWTLKHYVAGSVFVGTNMIIPKAKVCESNLYIIYICHYSCIKHVYRTHSFATTATTVKHAIGRNYLFIWYPSQELSCSECFLLRTQELCFSDCFLLRNYRFIFFLSGPVFSDLFILFVSQERSLRIVCFLFGKY